MDVDNNHQDMIDENIKLTDLNCQLEIRVKTLNGKLSTAQEQLSCEREEYKSLSESLIIKEQKISNLQKTLHVKDKDLKSRTVELDDLRLLHNRLESDVNTNEVNNLRDLLETKAKELEKEKDGNMRLKELIDQKEVENKILMNKVCGREMQTDKAECELANQFVNEADERKR